MELTPLAKGTTWQLPGAQDLPISFLVDVSVTVPAGTPYEVWHPTVVAKLIELANLSKDVLTVVHEDFRENIDFTPLWRALVEAGLMPYEPADWADDVTGPAPVIAEPTPTIKSTYKANELDQFKPATPCPFCGETERYRVNWVDVSVSDGPYLSQEFIPGTISCLNPECSHGPNAAQVITNLSDTTE